MIRIDASGRQHIDPADHAARAKIMQARQASGKQRRALKRPPAWRYPDGAEMRYRIFMRKLAAEWKKIVSVFVGGLGPLIAERDAEHRADAWPASLEKVLNNLKIGLDMTAAPQDLGGRLLDIGNQTADFNKKEWQKIVKGVLGVEAYTPERFLKSHIESFVKENAALITKLKEDVYGDVSRIVTAGIRNGDRVEQIKKDLLSDSALEPGRFRKVETRAELIARDQVGKLNGELTLNRQTALGIGEYIWRTVKDERVRGNPGGLYPDAAPSHWDREGKKYKWSDPPEGGHPGEAIQCRCFAEPVFEDTGLVEAEAGPAVAPPKEAPPPESVAATEKAATEKESVSSKALVSEFSTNYKASFGDLSVKYIDTTKIKNTALNAADLHKDALQAEPVLRDIVGKSASKVGGEAYFGPENKYAVKSISSLNEKINIRGKAAESITDAVRGTVIVEDIKDLKGAVTSLKQQIESSGGKILQVDDKYASPLISGYVGIHLDVVLKTPAGKLIRSEIQVHDHDMSVKELSEKLYQSVRTQKFIPETIMNQSRGLYAPFMKKNMR
jgi:SPP1 gp7 family putative phage head morphogenesis protein